MRTFLSMLFLETGQTFVGRRHAAGNVRRRVPLHKHAVSVRRDRAGSNITRRSWMGRCLGICVLCSWGSNIAAVQTVRHGKILLVRGMFTVFSLGLDDLATRLTAQGYNTEVVPACVSHPVVDDVCRKYATNELSGPLVLIGHSLGGDLLPGLADRVAAYRRVVDLLVMIDSTFPGDCPANVRRCVNLYQSNVSPEWFRIFRGAPIRAKSAATELVNVDIRRFPGQTEAASLDHFNIEASPWIHQMVINEVARLMAQPSGQTFERYLPPPSPTVRSRY